MTRLAPWFLVAGLVLVYPIATLASGGPMFPTREDCIRQVSSDGEVDAVFGYFDDEIDAADVRDRALELGFPGTELAWNGCGRVRVALEDIPNLAIGREFAEQARGVGFEVTLEQAE